MRLFRSIREMRLTLWEVRVEMVSFLGMNPGNLSEGRVVNKTEP